MGTCRFRRKFTSPVFAIHVSRTDPRLTECTAVEGVPGLKAKTGGTDAIHIVPMTEEVEVLFSPDPGFMAFHFGGL